MNQFRSYKDLKFWQTARQTGLKTVVLTRRLPRTRDAWVITDQVIRSAFSIGANITEGFGKYKGKEYSRFLQISLGSARETEYWLEILKDLYPKFSKNIDEILSLNEQTIKMLVSTLKSLIK